MGSLHLITFAAGVLVGWLVLPMILGMVGQNKNA